MEGGGISGNTARYHGGGVYVTGGTFTMSGGEISGNTSFSSSDSDGGGVYVYYGTFKKLPSGGGQNSGIIYGNEETGVDANGVPLKNTSGNSNGHAVYFYSSLSTRPRRNTTAGQTDHIDSTTGRGLSANGNPPYGE
jgi:predicted outer membrane repeat protein